MKTHTVRLYEAGSPDNLKFEEVELGPAGAGEVRIRQTAIGLNFIETQMRSGAVPVDPMPTVLGSEAVGVVEEVGDGVDEFVAGDRIAYGGGMMGAYAAARTVKTNRLIKIPDCLGDDIAAATMMKGLTAQYLIRQTYAVQAGQTVLFHAAAGGVGMIACQWLKHLGATVIGTVGSPVKAEFAASHGCDYVINYNQTDFSEAVSEITDGNGVDVVYDSIGRLTFEKSLSCLRSRGMMVWFGTASGPVAEFDPGILGQKGSLYLTRVGGWSYNTTREELLASANEVFEVIDSGAVRARIRERYALRDVARAHRDIESRQTIGMSILIP